MKSTLIRIALVAALLLPNIMHAQEQQQRLSQHVYTLASDSLRGRKAGSPDGLRAAQYIVGQYKDMGLQPLLDDYLVPFTFPNREIDITCNNIIGIIEGSDPVLKRECLVIGAHYDHLGVRLSDNAVYNGADDNASGSAAVIEIARQLLARQKQLKRSIIIVNFDAEELGLYGSRAMVGQFKDTSLLGQHFLLDNVKLMMSIDMVGWLKQGKKIQLTGTAMLKDLDKVLNEVAQRTQMPVATHRLDENMMGSTDSEPFAQAGVPALHVTTGIKSPYHKPQDDADLIDYEGLNRVTDYLADAIFTLANRDQLESTGIISPKHSGQLKTFQAGLAIGFGRDRLSFHDAAFTSSSNLGAHAGAMIRINNIGRLFALQLEAYYDRSFCKFPALGNNYSDVNTYRQSAITFPLSFQIQMPDYMAGYFLGFGGYYTRVLETQINGAPIANTFPSWQVNPNQWGLQWNLGMRITNFVLSVNFLYQVNRQFLPASVAPKVKNHYTFCTLAYLF